MSAAPQWRWCASWLGTDARRASTRRTGVENGRHNESSTVFRATAARRRLVRHGRVAVRALQGRARGVGDDRSSMLGNQPMGGISKPCANKISSPDNTKSNGTTFLKRSYHLSHVSMRHAFVDVAPHSQTVVSRAERHGSRFYSSCSSRRPWCARLCPC